MTAPVNINTFHVTQPPHAYIRYQDLREVRISNPRVGILVDPQHVDSEFSRVIVVSVSGGAACYIAANLRNRSVRVLHLNTTVFAIIHEIQVASHEHSLLVDALGNLWPRHQRVLVQIGLKPMPNRYYLTSILRWEHARLLAAHTFF